MWPSFCTCRNRVGGNASLAFGYIRFFLPFQQTPSTWRAAVLLASRSLPGPSLLSHRRDHRTTWPTPRVPRAETPHQAEACWALGSLSEHRSIGMINTQPRPIPLHATQPPSPRAEVTFPAGWYDVQVPHRQSWHTKKPVPCSCPQRLTNLGK